MAVPFGEVRIYAKQVRTNGSYFSAKKFREWCVEEFGEKPSAAAVARRVGLSPQHVYNIWRGEGSLQLETYLRMVAKAGLPVGVWISHLHEKQAKES